MRRTEVKELADSTAAGIREALSAALSLELDSKTEQLIRNRVLAALDQALTPSRVESAERAFLDAVMRSQWHRGRHPDWCRCGDPPSVACDCGGEELDRLRYVLEAVTRRPTDGAAELDADGYPTEAALAKIREWKIASSQDLLALIRFIGELWYHRDGWSDDGVQSAHLFGSTEIRYHQFSVSTLGWSGNESLIEALEQNWIAWHLVWHSSRRGGHYVFQVELLRELLP